MSSRKDQYIYMFVVLNIQSTLFNTLSYFQHWHMLAHEQHMPGNTSPLYKLLIKIFFITKRNDTLFCTNGHAASKGSSNLMH